MKMKRRDFLKFVGGSSLGVVINVVAGNPCVEATTPMPASDMIPRKHPPCRCNSVELYEMELPDSAHYYYVAENAIQEGDAVVLVSPGRVRSFTKADISQ